MIARQSRQACPHCGQLLPPLDGFCANCGQPAPLLGGGLRLTSALLPAATLAGGLLLIWRYAGALQTAAGPARGLVVLLAGRWGAVVVTGLLLLLATIGLEIWSLVAGVSSADRPRAAAAAGLLLAVFTSIYVLCWTLLWSAALFPLVVQYFCAGYALGMQTGRLRHGLGPISGWRWERAPLTAAGAAAGYALGAVISGYAPGAATLLLTCGLLGAGGAGALYLPTPGWLLRSQVGLQLEARLRWVKGHRAWLVAALFVALAYFAFG